MSSKLGIVGANGVPLAPDGRPVDGRPPDPTLDGAIGVPAEGYDQPPLSGGLAAGQADNPHAGAESLAKAAKEELAEEDPITKAVREGKLVCTMKPDGNFMIKCNLDVISRSAGEYYKFRGFMDEMRDKALADMMMRQMKRAEAAEQAKAMAAAGRKAESQTFINKIMRRKR